MSPNVIMEFGKVHVCIMHNEGSCRAENRYVRSLFSMPLAVFLSAVSAR